ncbi:MAG: threonine/serine dehydratase [Rhodothermales bacterium]
MINVQDEVVAAEERIRPYVRETPLEFSFFFSGAANNRTYLKLENVQRTGSFKLRGAFNKLLALDDGARDRGILTASTGNHGLAVAHALHTLGLCGSICLPENASRQKVAMLRHYGVDLLFHGTDGVEAERYARHRSAQEGIVYISPYNDPHIIGGQGTVAVEVLRQLDAVDCVMASVGGGGLVAGVAGYLKAMRPEVEVIGCLPQHSQVMYDSIQAGHIVESTVLPTLSDGTAGGIEAGAITFDLCRRYVDDWVLVDEPSIRHALKLVFDQHRLVIEGAAAVTVASFLQIKERLAGKTVALILCGGNIDIDTFKTLVC